MPAARAPLENRKYLLQETPYLRNLRVALDQSLMRPVSYHNKERHLIMVNCIEQTAVPVLLTLSLLINAARYFYINESVGSGDLSTMLIVQPITIVLPLLPLIFPTFWFLLNVFGLTKIRTILLDKTPTQVCEIKKKNYYNYLLCLMVVWMSDF